MEGVEVVRMVQTKKSRNHDGCECAEGGFFRGGGLENLCAEIRGLQYSEMGVVVLSCYTCN